MESMTLYELNNLVKCVLAGSLPDDYWVQAELSEVHVAVNGHCYMELVQKAERGSGFVAKARAMIWNNTFRTLKTFFEQETGQRFTSGLKVLVQVQVQFHEVYGYSLVVNDIDPTYTMGDMVRRRKEIIERLKREGVFNCNKELEMPLLPQRVAVVSSATAAGYGDFMDQLRHNKRGLVFYTRLFPAIMQGEDTEHSIITALERVAEHMEQWDVVVLIRGGGATSDLTSFDTYNLANNVAQFPLPIITGIGHERDDTVLDMVAHTRVKTPTAAAAFLLQCAEACADATDQLSQRMVAAVMQHVQSERQRMQQMVRRLPLAFMQGKSAHLQQLALIEQRLSRGAHDVLTTRRHALTNSHDRLWRSVPQLLTAEKNRLALIEQTLKGVDPEVLLQKGYSITLKEGHVVTSSTQLQKGEQLVTRFHDGQVTSVVE